MNKSNIGSSFDDYLKEDGIHNEIVDLAVRKIIKLKKDAVEQTDCYSLLTENAILTNVIEHLLKTKKVDKTLPEIVFQTALQEFLVYVNPVTCAHIHHQVISKKKLDALSNFQIDLEKLIKKYGDWK